MHIIELICVVMSIITNQLHLEGPTKYEWISNQIIKFLKLQLQICLLLITSVKYCPIVAIVTCKASLHMNQKNMKTNHFTHTHCSHLALQQHFNTTNKHTHTKHLHFWVFQYEHLQSTRLLSFFWINVTYHLTKHLSLQYLLRQHTKNHMILLCWHLLSSIEITIVSSRTLALIPINYWPTSICWSLVWGGVVGINHPTFNNYSFSCI